MKPESDFSKPFRHWIMANPPKIDCTFELKHTRGKEYLPFSELDESQENYAISISTSPKGVLIRNQGGNGEPDYTYHYKQPAFIVIKYPKGFEVIEIQNFIAERERSGKRKSLTYERAQAISTFSV